MKLFLFTPVKERLKNLHPNLKRKMRASLDEILANPHSGKELQDELKGFRTYRVGRFRIIYAINQKGIHVIGLGPRATIYEDTLHMLKTMKKPN